MLQTNADLFIAFVYSCHHFVAAESASFRLSSPVVARVITAPFSAERRSSLDFIGVQSRHKLVDERLKSSVSPELGDNSRLELVATSRTDLALAQVLQQAAPTKGVHAVGERRRVDEVAVAQTADDECVHVSQHRTPLGRRQLTAARRHAAAGRRPSSSRVSSGSGLVAASAEDDRSHQTDLISVMISRRPSVLSHQASINSTKQFVNLVTQLADESGSSQQIKLKVSCPFRLSKLTLSKQADCW